MDKETQDLAKRFYLADSTAEKIMAAKRASGKAKLVKTSTGWALDLSNTSERQEIMRLFGACTLPLPLTTTCPYEDALAFARGSDMGREHGVEG